MGLPDTTSRTVYKIREAEAPILSATITVMKKISFRSIFLVHHIVRVQFGLLTSNLFVTAGTDRFSGQL